MRRDSEHGGRTLQLLEPRHAEIVEPSGLAPLAAGRHDEHDPVAAGGHLGHRAGGEHRLVVGMSMEADQRARHVPPVLPLTAVPLRGF